MKKVLCILAVVCILLSMGACKKDDTTPQTTTQEPTAPATTTVPEETVIAVVDPTESQSKEWTQVYGGAVKDYMNPVEDHSWARQYAPEFVMIHFTSAVVNHRSDPYNIDYIRKIYFDYDVSVHYVIERDGTIHCYIPEDRVAWHAGRGEYGNDPKYTNKMNLYAIGIELIGMGSKSEMAAYLTSDEYDSINDSLKGFTTQQYAALRLLVEDICKRHNIPMDRQHIIGHQDYSPDMTDPGRLFDWSKILP